MRDESGHFWGGSGPPQSPIIDEETSLASAVFNFLHKCNSGAEAQTEVETGRKLTFGELKRLCLSVAQGLKSLGIRENDVVSIVAFNSQESQVVMFASILLGATVSPIDPLMSPEVMAECLKLAEPKLIYVYSNDALESVEKAVALANLQSVIVAPEHNPRHASFQSLLKPLDPEFKPTIATSPRDHLAMIVFTSGSTGVPKGALLGDLYFTFNFPIIGETYMMTSSLFWVSGILICLWSLWKGMRIVFFRNSSEDEFTLRTIHQYKPTAWCAQPTCLFRLLKMKRSDYDLSSVQLILTTGEPLSSEYAMRVQKEIFDNRTPVVQIFGTTETGIVVLNSNQLNKLGSSGILKPGVCVKVEDTETKECQGPGREGEICIRHPYMSKGYLKGASGRDEEGWFRTGDVGFIDEEGYLFVIDRTQNIIQFGAYQIVPSEIEGVLRSHPGVKEAAVFGIPDYVDREHPAAFVVAEKHVTEKDLHDLIAKMLPESRRIRGGVRFVDSIPKTRTGKIMRRVLCSKFIDARFDSSS